MVGTHEETIAICKTIMFLEEALEDMNDLTSKDDSVETYLKPYKKIQSAIAELVKLMAYENGLIVKEEG